MADNEPKIREEAAESMYDIASIAIDTGDDPKEYMQYMLDTGQMTPTEASSFMRDYDGIELSVRDNKDMQKGTLGVMVANEDPTEIIKVQKETGQWDDKKAERFSKMRAAMSDDEGLQESIAKEQQAQELAKSFGDTPDAIRNVGVGIGMGTLDILATATKLHSEDTSDFLLEGSETFDRAAAIAGREDEDSFGKVLRGGARSMFQAAALAPFGGYSIVAGFALNRAVQADREARMAGLGAVDKAGYVGRAAAIEGGITSAFQAVGLGGLEAIGAGDAAKAGIVGYMTNLFKQVGAEVTEEVVVEIADMWNQKYAGIDTSAWSSDQLLRTLKDTTLQTLVSMGGHTAFSSIRSLASKSQIAESISNRLKISPEAAAEVVRKATEAESAGKDFHKELGAQIEREAVKTPLGAGQAIQQNAEGTQKLAEKSSKGEPITQEDMTEAGLPEMENDAERVEVAENIQQALELDDDYGPKRLQEADEELNIIKEEVPEVITQTLAEIESGREMGSVTDFWDGLGREAKSEIDQWIGLVDEEIGDMAGDETRFRAVIDKIQNDPGMLGNLTEQKPLSRREFKEKMGMDPKKPLPDELKTQEARDKALQDLQEPATAHEMAKVEKEVPKVVSEPKAPVEAGKAPIETAAEPVKLSKEESNKLVEDNVKIAEQVARKFARKFGLNEEDMFSPAQEALVEASRRFDPSIGTPFDKYARNYIDGVLRNVSKKETGIASKQRPIEEGDQIAAPEIEGLSKDQQESVLGTIKKMGVEDQDLFTRKINGDTNVKIADKLGISPEAVRKRLNKIRLKMTRALEMSNKPQAKSAIRVMNREYLKSEVKERFGYTGEEADASIAIADAVAERLVKDGHFENINDFYNKTIEDVISIPKDGDRAKIQFLENGKVLFKATSDADASSFVHEWAHFMRRISSEYYPADMKAIESWAGVKENKWTQKTEEKFAKAFEKYLSEGKAPTRKLQAVFAKFKQWMADIYKTLIGSPRNVRLSDNVRAFFDKMLGKEAQVEKPKAKKKVGREAFINKKMFPATWQLAKDFMLPGKNQAKTAGIDIQAVKESAPELYRQLPNDGAGWDIAAIELEGDNIGFTVGDKTEAQALFDYLMAEHDATSEEAGLSGEIDAEGAQALYEQYAEQFADEDSVNELSQGELEDVSKKLGLKFVGLSKDKIIMKIKKKLAKRPKGKAVKTQIRKATGQAQDKPTTDLTNEQLLKLDELAAKKGWKAGKKEMQAFKKSLFNYAKDNLPVGVREKAMTAIKNATTYNAFKKALDRIDVIAEQKMHKDAVNKAKKAIDKAEKFNSGGEAFKKMFPFLKSEMENLLGDVDTKKRSKGLKEVIDYLQDDTNTELEAPAELSKYVEDGIRLIGTRNINDMTLEELQQLTDSINYLLHAQKGLAKNIHMDHLGENKNVLDEIAKVIGTPKQKATGQQDTVKDKLNRMIWKRIGHDIESMTVMFDSGDDGPMQKFFSDQSQEAKADRSLTEKNFWVAFKERTGDMKIPKEWSSLLGKADTEQFNFGEGKREVNLTKAQKMYLYLLSQDAEGRVAMLESDGFVYNDQSKRGKITDRKGEEDIRSKPFTEDDIAQIEKSMSAKEIKVAKAIQDTMNTEIKNAINVATTQRFGFEKATKDNYMKIFRYQDDVKKSISDQLSEQHKSDPLNPSWMKERVGGKAKLIIPDVFEVFGSHAVESATYSAYLNPMYRMQSVLNDKGLRASLKAKFGGDALGMFKKFMDRQRGTLQNDPDAKFFGRLRRNYTISTLALRPSTWVAQTLSYPSAATEIEAKYLLKALPGGMVKENRKVIDSMTGKSEMFQNRFSLMQFDRDIGSGSMGNDLMQMLTGKRKLRDQLGYFISKFDQATVERIMLAAYFETQAKGGTMDDAVRLAEKAVRRTQPTFDIASRTWLGGSKNELVRYTTMFRSYLDKALVNMTIQYHKQGTIKSKEFARATGYVLVMGALANTARLALYGLVRGKDKDPEDYLKDVMMNTAGYLPYGGDMFKAMVSDYHNQDALNAPVFDAAKDFTDTFRNMGESFANFVRDEEGSDAKAWKKFKRAIEKGIKASRLTGLPIEGSIKFFQDARDVIKNAIGMEKADYLLESEEGRKEMFDKALEKAKWNDGPLGYQEKLTGRQKKQYDMAKENHAGKKIKILTNDEPVLDRKYKKEWGSKAEEKIKEAKERWAKSRETALEELEGYSEEDMLKAFREYWKRKKEDGGLGNKRAEAYYKRIRILRKFIKEKK